MTELTLSDGERLYYEVHGEGPPLLLVSGLGGVATFWGGHVPAFAERFTVVLHDHRGTGRSSPSRIDYSVTQMTGDLLQLMDHLGIEKAHLVGHSTGGAIGQTVGLDRPERLDRLVLSATWTRADPYFHRLFEVRAETLRHGGAAAYVKSSGLFMRPCHWIRDHVAEIEAQERASIAAFPPPEVMLSRIAAIRAFDREAELARLAAPTLVLGARDDLVTPAYYSEALGRLIPDATTVIFPEGGHFFPQVVRDDFIRIVSDFLTRPAAAAA